MWVWSDELANRFPAIRSQEEMGMPLVAYAVEQEANLEEFAREILASPRGLTSVQQLEHAESPIPGR